MSGLKAVVVERSEGETSTEVVEDFTLTATDIPGAELSETLDKHPVAALWWWLLCRGIKIATSVKKKESLTVQLESCKNLSNRTS